MTHTLVVVTSLLQQPVFVTSLYMNWVSPSDCISNTSTHIVNITCI